MAKPHIALATMAVVIGLSLSTAVPVPATAQTTDATVATAAQGSSAVGWYLNDANSLSFPEPEPGNHYRVYVPVVTEEPDFPVYRQKPPAKLRSYDEQVAFMASLHTQSVSTCKKNIENDAYRGNQAGWNAFCETLPAANVAYFEVEDVTQPEPAFEVYETTWEGFLANVHTATSGEVRVRAEAVN